MNKKTIALFSGGLDSSLAIKVILEQGVEVEALHFVTQFCQCDRRGPGCNSDARQAAEQFGIKFTLRGLKDEYIEIIKNPRHGYGKNINPCIDCRILMLRKAKEYMVEVGASFIITGEVLGQRPMSQNRKSIDLIEREAGLEGLILRPLSAKLFPPTLPEREGVVDRERLLKISGRSRKPQMELARDYDVVDYPCPAGGCLLTDRNFAAKMRDIMSFSELSAGVIPMLKAGRHFRLSPKVKLVVGRDEKENERLEKLARPEDTVLDPVDINGPVAVVQGGPDGETIQTAAGIVARYCDSDKSQKCKIQLKGNGETGQIMEVLPFSDERIKSFRIC